MLVIVITVITQGPRVPEDMRGPIKGSLLINDGVFQAIGVISIGESSIKPDSNVELINASLCLP